MKKYLKIVGLTLCMSFASGSVWASEVPMTPLTAAIEQSNDEVSIHQINLDAPITRAEFIIAMVKSTGVELPQIMDTHYALPAMQRASDLGIIDLEAYPMETWSQIMPKEEKLEILTKAMQNNGFDMGKVYDTLNQILIEKVTVNGKEVDLCGLPISHYQGHVMLPLRPVAEAMGFKVTWEPKTYTATLNNGEIQSAVQVGFDMYNYSSVKAIGMSAPFSAGAAPRLIDGTVYVPAEYFGMFADSQVSNHTLQYTLK
ncbi:MAG: copper amine oxidase N-terminal domain-containing protein [Cellulosilyticaceae bacterium]